MWYRLKNYLLQVIALFRPFGIQAICLVLIIIVLVLLHNCQIEKDSWIFASLVGILSSSIVAIFIEMGNNRRRAEKRKRLLRDLYWAVLQYSNCMIESQHNITKSQGYGNKNANITVGVTAWKQADMNESDGIKLYAISLCCPQIREHLQKVFDNSQDLLSFQEFDLIRSILDNLFLIQSRLVSDYRQQNRDKSNEDNDVYNIAHDNIGLLLQKPELIGLSNRESIARELWEIDEAMKKLSKHMRKEPYYWRLCSDEKDIKHLLVQSDIAKDKRNKRKKV